jgi:hypothetical protein
VLLLQSRGDQTTVAVLLQVVIHGIADNWDNFNDDTLLEKAVSQ